MAESRTSEKAAGYTRPVDNLEPAEQAAIVTAKKYVGPKREVESCTMEREGDKFVVHLQFTSGPLGQDGNDCLVYVDKNGKVVDYFEGL